MGEALLAGAIAGFAIAIPIGPIAVLIFGLALHHGFRRAAPAAAGAASADGIYATLAGLFGAVLSSIVAPVIVPARIIGAGLLAFIGLRSLLALRSSSGTASQGVPVDTPMRTYAVLLGLTATNPMTFLYFAALMLGLPALSGGVAEKLGLAIAAFAASLSWQLFLVGLGATLHGRLPPAVRVVSQAIGGVVILGFAARILADAIVG